MTEPHDPQPADRAPYEAPADGISPYASPGVPTPPQGPTPRGVVSRRTLVVTAVAALVVGGVVGGLIGWASTDTSGPDRTTTVAQTRASGPTQEKGQGQHPRRARGVVGTITAINGSTWTIQTTKGEPFTVMVGSSTKYGTPKAPAQSSDFAVGDRIVATGARSGTTLDATRVVKRVVRGGGDTTAPSSAPPSTGAPS